MTLEVGEEYLAISMNSGEALNLVLKAVSEGKDVIWFNAFINKDRVKESQPVFVGDCSIWSKTKKEAPKEQPVNTVAKTALPKVFGR